MNRLITLGLVALVGLTACSDSAAPLRIGVKGFTEQRILGEMLTTHLRQAGVEVGALVECGDTWNCHQALRSARIDLLVDYTGTGLNFIGAPPGAATLERVRALYAPLGEQWHTALGFDNGYRVLVPADAADGARATTIADLARRDGLRVALPAEYLRRPRDGLAALANRYGLRLAPEPVVIESPAARYEAVRTGRADVAIGYATDGAIDELGFVALADPAGFFLPYDAVVVARDAALSGHPGLGAALAQLEGRISTRAMRGLNAKVQIEGRDARTVARAFLVEAKLIDPDAVTVESGPEIAIAVGSGDGLAPRVPAARRAVRAAWPDRPVRIDTVRNAREQLATGAARLAIVGAERLFRWSVRRLRWVQDARIEAIAVLGERRLHVIRKADDGAEPLAGRLGIQPRDTGVGQVGGAILRLVEGRPALRGTTAELMGAVRDGRLDGALVFAEAGDAAVEAGLAAGGLALRPLDGWLTGPRAVNMPFLRASRLPPATYSGQADAVETVGAQIVLAGAAPADALARGGGPAAALPTGGSPIAADRVPVIADALGISEAPDPALPTAWRRGSAPPDEPTGWRAAIEIGLNILAMLFSVWLVRLLVAPLPKRAAVDDSRDG